MEPAFHEKRDLLFKNPYQIVKSANMKHFVSPRLLFGARGGRGYLTKFTCNTGRFRPEFQPLSLLYTILAEKVTLFAFVERSP